MSTFTAYMEELIDNGYGGTDKRKNVWSGLRAKQAEKVWNDCLQRKGVTEHAASD